MSLKADIVVTLQTLESYEFGMKIDTGFQIGTARFHCVCYGLRICDWFGVEVIKKYLGMRGIGVFDDFSGMSFFFERKRELEMDAKTHSKVNYLSCWGTLGIAQASRITEREGSIAPPKLIDRNF